jgi:tape measure domain-containing protein
MAMDVSRLGIVVDSGGTITKVSKELSGLGTSAGNAERRVQKLTATIDKLLGSMANLAKMQGTANSAVEAHIQKVQNGTAAMKAMQSSASATARTLGELQSQATKTGNAFGHAHHKAGIFNNTLKSMAVAASAYLGLNFAKGIVESADAWGMMQSKLKLALGTMENARAAQADLFDLSQEMRVPLDETGKLYVRLSNAMQKMGKSHQETLSMVKSVSLALQLQGATTAEAASTMLQFSQAANAGRLNGAEFNSISENGTLILRALEEHLGKNRAELKKMGSEGKLTFDLIDEALRKVLPKWEEDFKTLPITVGGSIQRIKNAWMKAMGELNEDTGMNKGIVRFMHVIEQTIPLVRDGMANALSSVFEWIDTNSSALGQIWTQVKGIVGDIHNMASAVAGVVGMAGEATGEFSLIGAAIYSARLLLAGFQDGLVFIGGLLLKIGAGIYKTIALPFEAVLLLVEKIVGKFGSLVSAMGAVSTAVGLESLGGKLTTVADAIKSFSSSVGSVREGITSVGNFMEDTGNNAIKFLADGKGAVQTLLRGEQDLTVAVKKRGQVIQDVSKDFKKSSETDKKVLKELEKAHKEASSSLEKTITAYKEQAASLEALQKFGLDGDKRTKTQKEQLVLEGLLANATNKKVKAVLQDALATNKATQEMERHEKLLKEHLERQKEREETTQKAIKDAEEEAQKNEDLVRTFGMAKGALEELELARVSEQLTRAKSLADNDHEIEQLQRLHDALDKNAKARKLLGEKEGQKKLAEEAQKEWEKTVEKIDDIFREGFANMLNNGKSAWSSFTKSLSTTFKTMVAEEIYKSFAKPFVVRMVGSFLGGPSGGMSNSGGMLSNLSSLNSLYNAGAALYQGYSAGGMAGVGNVLGQFGRYGNAVLTGGTMPVSTGGFGGGWVSAEGGASYLSSGSSMAGTAAGYAAGIGTGVGVGRAISNGYSVSGSGNGLVNAGTAVGAIFGPIGAAIGGTIAGVINRAFGRKPKETESFGFQGDFTDDGFMGGQNFSRWKQKGGWFRSDKSGTDFSPLDIGFADTLTESFKSISKATKDYASTLGLSTDAILGYRKVVIQDMTGDQAKDAEIVTGILKDVSNELSVRLLPSFADFAKKGEDASTTLQRLAVEFKTVEDVITMFGKTSEQAFGAVGLASMEARSRLVEFSGGIDAFVAQTSYFAQNFLSAEEQIAPTIKAVQKKFAELGISGIETKDQFKKLVLGLDLATEHGAKMYAELMGLTPAFVAVTDFASRAAEEAINKAKESAARVDEARSKVSEAYERESDALRSIIDKFRDFSKSLRDFRDSLLIGNLSNLSPEAKYLELKRRFESTSALAATGDQGALGSLQSISEQFLEASKGYFASSMGYTQDFELVRAALQQSAVAADMQVSNAERQLGALERTVSGILTVNNSVLSIKDAIVQYFAAGGTKAVVSGSSSVGGISNVSTVNPLSDPSTQFVETLYNQYLGRASDAEGLYHWTSALQSGTLSTQDVISGFLNSPEYQMKMDGSHANGLDRVPFDGYRAILHEGERVQTAAQAKDSDMTADLLREVLTELRAANAQRGAATEAQIAEQRKLAEKLEAQKRVLAAQTAD